MDSHHMRQALAIMVSHMTPARQALPPLRDGQLGRKWVQNFIKGHNKLIKVSKPTKQKAERFAACSGEVLATHFATVERRIVEYEIDAECM